MLPAVSVVMPVRDEERHLADSVACVLEQEYPGGFELILAVGPSKDRTEAIARECAGVRWTAASIDCPGIAVMTSTGRPRCSTVATTFGIVVPTGPSGRVPTPVSCAASRSTLRAATSVVGTLAT